MTGLPPGSSGVAANPNLPGGAPALPPPPISDAEFQVLQDFFYRKTGITFGDSKRYFVDRRLIDRMAATGSDSMRAYMMQLKYQDPAGQELQLLINAMTVNETYFYREEYQFRCLVAAIMPEIVAARMPSEARPIRLWSLPCSTGEEPYSLAIQLLENWPDVNKHDIEISASDIDTSVLRQARAGLYEDRSVQNLPASVKARYFVRGADARWQLNRDLRESVDFFTVNLSDRRDMARHAGRFDVIFCRNLLIYFDELSRRQAAEALFDALRPGGFLCLGHSESMSRISALFTVRKFPDAIVYQKPA
jgi:chemotaxis protein methyltransferase CheR